MRKLQTGETLSYPPRRDEDVVKDQRADDGFVRTRELVADASESTPNGILCQLPTFGWVEIRRAYVPSRLHLSTGPRPACGVAEISRHHIVWQPNLEQA